MTFINFGALPDTRQRVLSVSDDVLKAYEQALAEINSYRPMTIHPAEYKLQSTGRLRSNATPTITNATPEKTLSEQLFDSAAAAKIETATVAMHLDDAWRRKFFLQLDSLLDIESWDTGDASPSRESFKTLLRMLLMFAPERRPGIGATSDGHFVAAWTSGADRLTIETLEKDRVKWVLSCDLDGSRESAAGNSWLANLKEILAPFKPERWFRADNLPRA